MDCQNQYMAIAVTSVALLVSMCVNVALYLLRKHEGKNIVNPMYEYRREPCRRSSLQSYRFDDEEMERQENPIYGNICFDGGGLETEVCYEQMSLASTVKQNLKQVDVSYASLDLTANKKRRKKRKYQKQGQTHQAQTHTEETENCLDQDAEVEVALPSRTSSLMVSRHSIYLNSHQVALEAEERLRQLDQKQEQEMAMDDNAEEEFQMRRNVHEEFDQSSIGVSRQSLELGS